MLAHFSIDVGRWQPPPNTKPTSTSDQNAPLKILHAPNHRAIKGTAFFNQAVAELVAEGLKIEFILLEKVPNNKVKEIMASVDVVADQLIIGWYAMFALEAMAMGKPVLCFLRDDLKQLYITAGLITADELPLVNCSPATVKATIKALYFNRDKLVEIGERSQQFVIKHHSLKAVGNVFDRINRSIGLEPEGAK
jgi:hypothetical protein